AISTYHQLSHRTQPDNSHPLCIGARAGACGFMNHRGARHATAVSVAAIAAYTRIVLRVAPPGSRRSATIASLPVRCSTAAASMVGRERREARVRHPYADAQAAVKMRRPRPHYRAVTVEFGG